MTLLRRRRPRPAPPAHFKLEEPNTCWRCERLTSDLNRADLCEACTEALRNDWQEDPP